MDPNTAAFEAAAALRYMARDEALKAYVLESAPLHNVLLRAALRFIGGETLAQCLETAQRLQQQGFIVSIDYMGESTRDQAVAQQAVQEFVQLIEAIAAQNLPASVSLDLSHLGLAIDPELAFQHAAILAQAASVAGLEIMISMEGSERTETILEIHRRLSEQFANVGITLQAYLYRTENDLTAVLDRPGKIRLVKGAYAEPAAVALPRGATLDRAYGRYMERILASGHLCSIATHDPALLDHAHEFIERHGLGREPVEFEMLYGIMPEHLQAMHEFGYQTRVYLPYGQEWYLYLCHRLAEYPPNIYQAITDMVQAPHSGLKVGG